MIGNQPKYHLDFLAFFAKRIVVATEGHTLQTIRAWRIDADRIAIVDLSRPGDEPLVLFEGDAFDLYLQFGDIFEPNPSAEEQARDSRESKPRRLGMAA